jgi:hypothetical protein
MIRMLLAPHLERIFPVVGGPGSLFRERTNEGAGLHTRHVVGIGPRVVTARPQLFIQLGEGAGLHHLGAQHVALFFGAIHPVDGRGLGQMRHLFHPLQQVGVAGGRLRVIGFDKNSLVLVSLL